MFGFVNNSKQVYNAKIPLIQIYLMLKPVIRGELKKLKKLLRKGCNSRWLFCVSMILYVCKLYSPHKWGWSESRINVRLKDFIIPTQVGINTER